MQAVTVLFASLIIGLALCAILLSYTVTQQRRDAIAETRDVLDLAEGGATRAAWTLDSGLAKDVVASALATASVHRAVISDEQGNTLADAEKPLRRQGAATAWLIETFFRDALEMRRDLLSTEGGELRLVGALFVALAPNHVADTFFALAKQIVVATLIQSFLVGLVLLWFSSRLVTTPLRRVARTIETIDPQHPEQMFVSVPPRHQGNELGHLLEHTNRMLERLAMSQDQLRRLATRDPLTGLLNRDQIRDRLTSALARADRNESRVAVLFLDLDRFKNVNDSLGHDAGDDLLVAVAKMLTEAIRANDSAGRLGGDEFLVVLEDIFDLEDVVLTVERIDDVLSTTFSLRSQQVRTSASIGITIYPDDGKNVGDLMRQADLAMYTAKGGGGSRWHFFAQEMSATVETRLRLESALGGALDRGEFVLHFQPKFEARGGGLAGCEALLRWQRDGVLLRADNFVSVAEDIGIILEIGDWALTEVCRQIQEWARQYRVLPISLNVSARQVRNAGFVGRVEATVKRHEIEGELLEIELTETVLMEELDRSYRHLAQLRKLGIAISVDDFGTGYSSLSYLARLPISALKIDKSFVSGSRRSKVVLSAIIAMAKASQIQTVAEGVETEQQRALMIKEGCDLLQGHLLGPPLPAADFEQRFLSRERPVTPKELRHRGVD